MRALFTSPSFKRYVIPAVALCWLALLSTGDSYFFTVLGMLGFTWLMYKLGHEFGGLEGFMLRMLSQVLLVMVVMVSAIMPVIELFTPTTQERILVTWFWLGVVLIMWWSAKIWWSPRWSLRREFWAHRICLVTIWMAAMVLGEGHRSDLKGKNYRHSARLAVPGLAAAYLMLHFLISGRLLIMLVTSFDIEGVLMATILLSPVMWFATVLVRAINIVRNANRAILVA